MTTVASLGIALGLDPAGFRAGLARSVADLDRFAKKVEATSGRFGKLGTVPALKLDTRDFHAKHARANAALEQLARKSSTVTLGLDATKFKAGLASATTDLNKFDRTGGRGARLDLDVRTFRAGIASAQKEWDQLTRKSSSPVLGLDTKSFRANLAAASKDLSAFAKRTETELGRVANASKNFGATLTTSVRGLSRLSTGRAPTLDLDTRSFHDKLSRAFAALDKLARKSGTVTLGIDATKFFSGLSGAQFQLDRFLQTGRRGVKVDIDARAFRTGIAGAARDLDQLSRKSASPVLGLDTKSYHANLSGASRDLGAFSRQTVTDFGRASNASRSFGASLATNLRGLAVLAGVTASVVALKRLTQAGFDFNATIESATLGIATLITAQTTLTDSTGRVLAGTEALDSAMGLATDQITKLRIAGIQTAATTEELVQAMQQGLAPGLAAGLDLDTIRKTVIAITLAAQTMGIPMRQLNEEVRSILAGTITMNSRIAKNLNITNEQVAAAKEQGRLQEFLNAKLQVFTIAGKRAALTFAATTSNIREAMSLFLGTATKPLFDSFVRSANAALLGVFDLESGGLTTKLQPLVGAFESAFAGFGAILPKVFDGALAGAVRLGEYLAAHRGQVEAIGSAFLGVVKSIASIVGAASGLVGQFVRMGVETGLFAGILRSVETILTAIAKLMPVIVTAFAGAQLGKALILFSGMGKAVTGASIAAAAAANPFLALAAATGVALVAFKAFEARREAADRARVGRVQDTAADAAASLTLVKSIDAEREALSKLLGAPAAYVEKMKEIRSLKQKLADLSPEYARALSNENKSWDAQRDAIARVTAVLRSQAAAELFGAQAKQKAIEQRIAEVRAVTQASLKGGLFANENTGVGSLIRDLERAKKAVTDLQAAYNKFSPIVKAAETPPTVAAIKTPKSAEELAAEAAKAFAALQSRIRNVVTTFEETKRAGGDLIPILSEAERLTNRVATAAGRQKDQFSDTATQLRDMAKTLAGITELKRVADPTGMDALRTVEETIERADLLIQTDMRNTATAIELLSDKYRQVQREIAAMGTPLDATNQQLGDSIKLTQKLKEAAFSLFDTSPEGLKKKLVPLVDLGPLETAASRIKKISAELDFAVLAGNKQAAERAQKNLLAVTLEFKKAEANLARFALTGTLPPKALLELLEAIKNIGNSAGIAQPSIVTLGGALDQLVDTGRGLVSVADGFGRIGDSARKALDGVFSLIAGVKNTVDALGKLRAAQQAAERTKPGSQTTPKKSGTEDIQKLANIASLAGGIVSTIGGIAQLASALFGKRPPSPQEIAAIEAAKENTKAILTLRDKITGFTVNAATIGQGLVAATRVAAATPQIVRVVANQPWDFGDKPKIDRVITEQVSNILRQTGLTISQMELIAKEWGITLRSSTGELLLTAFAQLATALELAGVSLTRFGASLEDQRKAFDARTDIFDLATDPFETIRREIGFFARQAPLLGDLFQGFDVASEAGRASLEAASRKLFEDLEAGLLTREQLGNLRTIDDVVQFLLTLDKSLDATTASVDKLGDAADKTTAALRNVPTGFKIALARFDATAAEVVNNIRPPLTLRPEIPRPVDIVGPVSVPLPPTVIIPTTFIPALEDFAATLTNFSPGDATLKTIFAGPPAPTTTGGGSITFTGDITVVAGDRNPRQLLADIMSAAREQARAQGLNSVRWSDIT